MTISIQNKLMLLFVSLSNPLWQSILQPEPTQDKINNIIKVAHGTVSNWRKGGRIARLTSQRAFESTKDYIAGLTIAQADKDMLLPRIDHFAKIYANPDLDIRSAADALSMPLDECRRIIDEAIYDRRPIFPGMFYEASERGHDAAKEDFRRLQGLFHMWMRRGPLWLQCPLRVQYVLRIRDGYTIRCELSLPIIEAEDHEPSWLYDGFLIVRSHKLFWLFEKRESQRNDYLSFITCAGRTHKRHLTLSGTYLTTGQDALQSIVADHVLIKRIYLDDQPAIDQATSNDARVLTRDSGGDLIEELWKEFQLG